MWKVCIYTQSKWGIREEGGVWGKGKGEVNQEKNNNCNNNNNNKDDNMSSSRPLFAPASVSPEHDLSPKSPTVSRKAREYPYARKKIFTQAIPLIHGSVFEWWISRYDASLFHSFFLPLHLCFFLYFSFIIVKFRKRDWEAWSWLIDLWLFDYLVFSLQSFSCIFIYWFDFYYRNMFPRKMLTDIERNFTIHHFRIFKSDETPWWKPRSLKVALGCHPITGAEFLAVSHSFNFLSRPS